MTKYCYHNKFAINQVETRNNLNKSDRGVNYMFNFTLLANVDKILDGQSQGKWLYRRL